MYIVAIRGRRSLDMNSNNNTNTNTNIKQDIVQQQTKLIAELREENARLLTTITEKDQRIAYYKEMQQELIRLKSSFQSRPDLYSQLMQP